MSNEEVRHRPALTEVYLATYHFGQLAWAAIGVSTESRQEAFRTASKAEFNTTRNFGPFHFVLIWGDLQQSHEAVVHTRNPVKDHDLPLCLVV